ncbi:MAG: radical SAM protein [Blautia sp.]|uniref:radical SAM protein n=1 Tax=Blautia sp. TaxID=1955243 RepID=UPI003994FDBF
METIKKLVLLTVPIQHCNLQCDYCYISRVKDWSEGESKFEYSVDHMLKALTKERLGGTCLINITGGGETLIPPEIPKVIKGLLEEGHYMEVVTNGTLTKRFEEIAEFDKALLNRLEFKFSFHYRELKKKNLLETYVNNVHKMQKSGCSFTIESMPYDELIDDIDEIKAFAIENFGALPQVTVGRDDMKDRVLLTQYTEEEYKSIWSQFGSTMFEYKMRIYDERPKHFCYAGDWSLYVDLKTGNAQACYGQPVSQNIFKDLSKPIKFRAVGHHCTMPYCLNGHAFLSLGMQPEFKGYSYFEIRNRETCNDTKWFSTSCEQAFSQKLYENNEELSSGQKIAIDALKPFEYVGTLKYSKEQIIRRLRKHKQKKQI